MPGGRPPLSEGHRFGHTASSTTDPSDEPEPGKATSKARKWTCSDIIEYLRDLFVDIGRRPKFAQDYGLMALPSSVVWPRGLGSALGENRTPAGLLAARAFALRRAPEGGPIRWPVRHHLVPISDWQSELRIVNFAPKANTGVIIYGQGYGIDSIGDAMASSSYAKKGFVEESALGFFFDGRQHRRHADRQIVGEHRLHQ